MKRIILSTILLLGLSAGLMAQKNHAINVKVSADDSKVHITYDLPPNGSHRAFDITLQTENNSVRPRTIQGTGRGINAGNGLTIDWYYTADGYTKADLNGLKIVVMAIDPLEQPTNSVENNAAPRQTRRISPWAGLSTLGATGVGLLTSGLVTEGNAQEEYDIYVANVNPDASIYQELGVSRNDLYDQANGKHKRGLGLAIGGGAVIVAAGVILIQRLSLTKKLNSMETFNRLEVRPQFNPGMGFGASGTSSAAGLQVGWRF